jgi:hypothetical protein
MDKIYNSQQEARQACKEYVQLSNELRERFGVAEVSEDSCCDVYISTLYRDADGQVLEYNFFE